MENLTLYQRKFLKNYLETGNISQSAIKAGYKHRQRGVELVSKSVIQDAFQQLMDKKGLTDEKLLNTLSEGLNATKVVGYLHQYKKGEDGKIETANPGEVVSNEFIEVPDYAVRHKYLETALKLKGMFKEPVPIDKSQHYHYTNLVDVILNRNGNGNRKEVNPEVARDGVSLALQS